MDPSQGELQERGRVPFAIRLLKDFGVFGNVRATLAFLLAMTPQIASFLGLKLSVPRRNVIYAALLQMLVRTPWDVPVPVIS